MSLSTSRQKFVLLASSMLATYLLTKRRNSTLELHALCTKIQQLSPAVWSSITFKSIINKKYLAAWLKIKKQLVTNDLRKDLSNVLAIIIRTNKRDAVKTGLIKHGKKNFKKYQQERSDANNGTKIIAPISATPSSVVDIGIYQLLKPSATDVVYDLGCGDGRWLIRAAEIFGCRGVGVDIEETRLKIGRSKAARTGVTHLVNLQKGDIFDMNLSDCTMVICYLFGESTTAVRRQVLRTLRHGCLVLSVSFAFKQEDEDDGNVEEGKGKEKEKGSGRLELVQTLDEGVERKLLLYRWVKC